MKDIVELIALILGPILYVWWEKRKVRKALLTPEQLLATLQKSSAIYKRLSDIRDQFRPKRVYLFQFQNGGKWHSGESIQRMSITHESKYYELRSIKQKNQNVLITAHDHPFLEELLMYKVHVTDDVSTLQNTSYKIKLDLRQVRSIYYFLLEEPKSRRPIGTLVLSFPIRNGLDATNVIEIKEHALAIAEILNKQ